MVKLKKAMKGLRVPLINVGIAGVVIGLAIWFNLLGLGEGIQIIILLGLVFVTAQYAKSAAEQADASKRMAELSRSEQEWMLRPYINLEEEVAEETVRVAEVDCTRLSLRINNVGRTPTRNVVVHYKFQSEKSPVITKENSFMCEDVFTNSPCTCLFAMSDEMRSKLEQNEQIRFEMKVTYSSVFGREHQTIYRWGRSPLTNEWITEHCEWT